MGQNFVFHPDCQDVFLLAAGLPVKLNTLVKVGSPDIAQSAQVSGQGIQPSTPHLGTD